MLPSRTRGSLIRIKVVISSRLGRRIFKKSLVTEDEYKAKNYTASSDF